MNFDILKLLDTPLTLAAGGHIPISIAAESIGVSRDTLLRLATKGEIDLFVRLPRTDGYILPRKYLESDGGGNAEDGGLEIPTSKHMPEIAIQVQLGGLMAIPSQEAMALSSAILSEVLPSVPILLLDVPNKAGNVFAPDDAPEIPVNALEVDAQQVENLRIRLAAKLTPAQIELAKQRHIADQKPLEPSKGQKANKLFSVALEAYAKDTSGIPGSVTSETEQLQKYRGCALLVELIGDIALSAISPDTLREFRTGLKDLPGNANHIKKEYRRETMVATSQALKDGGINWPKMTESAQLERMQWLDQMFRWLVSKEWLTHNPMASVLGEKTKTAAERKAERQARAVRKTPGEVDDSDNRSPFSDVELKQIFAQVHFSCGNGSLITGNETSWYPFEYWLPLIALHAGCRIKEVSQLHLSDIAKGPDGIWYFDINEKTHDKSLKNATATRHIPVSPVLIELGLISYRDRLIDEGYRRLFPELTYSLSDARYAKESKRRMSAMFESLGMPRNGTKVFHCLRANFNDALLRVPFSKLPFDDNDLKRYIRFMVVGHQVTGVNEAHYSSTTMAEKLALVAGLKYELPGIAKFDIDFAVERVRFALGRKIGSRRGREDLGPLNNEIYGD